MGFTPTTVDSADVGAAVPQTCGRTTGQQQTYDGSRRSHLDLVQEARQARQAGPTERVHQLAKFVLLSSRLTPHPLFKLWRALLKLGERRKGNENEGRERVLDKRV
mgnify:CR=1 FL=1